VAGLNRFTRKFWPGSIWAGLILLLTGLPGNYFPDVESFWDWVSPDKLVHFFIFGVFTFLTLWGYRAQYKLPARRYYLVGFATLLGIFYGGVTEILQEMVFTGRYGNVFDFLANAIGAILGSAVFMLLARKNKKENASFLE